MDLIKLNNRFIKLTKEKEKAKAKLVSEINRIIKPIFNQTVSTSYNIKITIKKIDKNLCSPLANINCIEIWETDENEYASNYCFPISLLKITNPKNIQNTYKKIIDNFWKKEKRQKEKNKILQKIENEKNEKKEYLRLKRKFNK